MPVDPNYKLDVGGKTKFSTEFGSIIIGEYYHSFPGPKAHFATTLYGQNNDAIYLGNTDTKIGCIFVNYVDYQVLTQSSDARLKENIRPLPSMLEKIRKVQTYNYNYTDEYLKDFKEEEKEYYKRLEYGFLAQEFKEIFPELVYGNEETGTLSINYVSMIPILTSAINELRGEAVYKNAEIDELRNEIAELRLLLEECCRRGNFDDDDNSLTTLRFKLSDNPVVYAEKMSVEQNTPNPFNENTTIRCYIPKNIGKVQLCVYNMQGAQLKCIDIADRGTVDVVIEAGQLSSGVYSYLLIGDGKASEAKQMILTK